jgi:hypothetical protein
MAAAIGDLEWLKQSLRLSSELTFDKNVNRKIIVVNLLQQSSCFLFKGIGYYSFGSCQLSNEYFKIFN